MKILNIKKGVMKTMIELNNIDITDRQPCWEVHLDDPADRNKTKWVVGVKSHQDENAPKEYRLKLTDLGDVNDDDFWNHITSVDFAVKLLDVFRSGNLDSWVKGGCKI